MDSTIKLLGINLKGLDAERYLHGRTTQNIKKLSVGEYARSLLLTPNGRVICDLIVNRNEKDSFSVFSSNIDFSGELLCFKVSDNFETIDLGVFFLHPNTNSETVAEHTFKINNIPFALSKEETPFPNFDNIRIVNFIPWYPFEINDKIIAPELPLDSYVSFNKGCYSGQEVVETASARGKVSRSLLRIKCADGFSEETELFWEEKKVGQITSTASDGSNTIAFAFAKKEMQEFKTRDEKKWIVF